MRGNDDGSVLFSRGTSKRGVTPFVFGIHICLQRDETLDYVEVTAACSDVEWGLGLVVRSIQCGALRFE